MLLSAAACSSGYSASGFNGFIQPVAIRVRSSVSNIQITMNHDDDTTAAVHNLLQIASAHFAPLALSGAVRLQIPDILAGNELSVLEISEELHARHGGELDTDALERTLRLLCSAGALEQCQASSAPVHSYRLTAVGTLLRKENLPAGQPSLACAVESWTDPRELRAWANLPDQVLGKCHGSSAYEQANGGTVAQHLRHDRAYGELVAFIGSTELPALLASYDWSGVSTADNQPGVVLDVGGGHGAAMAAMSRAHPDLQCVNLDLEDVIRDAPSREGVTNVAGVSRHAGFELALTLLLLHKALNRCLSLRVVAGHVRLDYVAAVRCAPDETCTCRLGR